MFDKLSPDEWKAIVGVGMTLIGGITSMVLLIAAWTLKYIIKVERNTAGTAAAMVAIAEALSVLRTDNDNEHQEIHDRIDRENGVIHEAIQTVAADVQQLKGTTIRHGEQIQIILNRGHPAP